MIAEHAFGLMLAVARNVCRGNERYRQERRFDDTGLGGVELYGKTLGVIGDGPDRPAQRAHRQGVWHGRAGL